MLTRIKLGFKRAYTTGTQEGDYLPATSAALPRVWMILLVLALPFFVICADYFESLEHSGMVEAIIADISLPASVIGYSLLVLTLKRRKI